MNFYKYSLPLGASLMMLLFSLALTWYVGSEVRNLKEKVDGRNVPIQGVTSLDHYIYAFQNKFFPYPFLMIVSFIALFITSFALVMKCKKKRLVYRE
ncbi:hypothetical protein CHH78_12530 [Shouchella clausii]|jgi:hypothetical protein|uniref:DUF4306 domain-containing protein n=1 Tax=Shouchella clausii TaxID=79880 RepID=A0A268S291_SHOCL|nr:hypothetical protein CHH76_12390 [Shouchella clausii]PAD43401.1 hypothetical protein CHH54_07110 [Bacillus sp. 7520-S]PAD15144.1 hypothetical protein CHH74_07040 [Shouchella clausii]PAE81608.1 hypothetical protein CHH78_12530 [Shouchella clausii]PAE95791.1 hypothetical protein CHH71_14635 [Shouchella clausii]